MQVRSFRTLRRHRDFPLLMLLLVPVLTCGLPVMGRTQAAQTPPPSTPPQGTTGTEGTQGKDEPDSTQKPEKDRPKKDKALPPSNPLVLVNPQDGSGNMSEKFDRFGNSKRQVSPRKEDMGDYRNSPNDPRLGTKRKKPLPLFGYNFFLDARQRIDARRARLAIKMPRTEEDDTAPTRAGRQTGDQKNTKQVKPRAGTRDQQSDTDSETNPRVRRNADGQSDSGVEDDQSDDMPTPRRSRSRSRTRQDDGTSTDSSSSDDGTGTNGGERDAVTGLREDGGVDAYGQRTSKRRLPAETYADDPDAPGNNRSRSRTYRANPETMSNDDESDNIDGYTDEGDDYDRTLAQRRQGLTGSKNQAPGAVPLAGQSAQDKQAAPGAKTDGRDGTSDADNSSINAYYEVADPLSQLTRNVIASVTPNYQLAGGDVLTVRVWSATMAAKEYDRAVDALGNLDIPTAGRIVVRGMTLEKAQEAIQERLRRIYKNPKVSVQLHELRTISIIVSGEAYLPGTYNVPAVATAFNILYVAGGPTRQGSLRRIEVRRQGKLVGTLDFYKYLLTGQEGDIALQSGDLIFIPAYQSRVALRGEVRQPAVYELADGETLQDALKYAGGVKPSGVNQQVQVSTLDPGNSRVLKNADLKDAGSTQKLALYDGDSVDVFSVRPLVTNKVTVEGAVDQPNDYALSPGMRVSDLIGMARGPLSEAYLTRAELYRWNPDNTTTLMPVNLEKALSGDNAANIELARWDRLKLYTREEVAWTGYRKVEVRGAVQRPGIYQVSQNMHVSDLLMRVGGATPDAHLEWAALVHQHGDGSFRYDYVNLASAVKGDAANDRVIEDNDLLTVYKSGQAQFIPDHVVTIRGAVQAPGIYPRGDGMHVSELLKVAGGFKPGAATTITIAHARKPLDTVKDGVTVAKVAFDSQNRCAAQDDILMEDGDLVTVQGTGGFVDRVQIVTVSGWVNRPGPIVLKSKTMRLSDAIKEAGGLRPEAFPEGAEFFREPEMLSSDTQRELALNISKLNNLLNANAYSRERAKSYLERIHAAGSPADAGVTAVGSAPQNQPIPDSVEKQLYSRELVSRPRMLEEKQLTPTGNIAVNLIEALKHPGSTDDIIMVDGDTIRVPEQPTTVLVAGAVFNGRAVLFNKGASLDYYIGQSGGFAPDAAKDSILVVRAGGGTIPANRVHELRPGDFIFVPTRVQSEKVPQHSNLMESLFRNATNTFLLFRIFGL